MVPTFNFTNSHGVLNMTQNGTIWIKGDGIVHPSSKNNSSTDWLFVGGLISAGVLILLVVIAAIIIGIKCRRKTQAGSLTLAYRRIAADATPEDDDEDIKMLLG